MPTSIAIHTPLAAISSSAGTASKVDKLGAKPVPTASHRDVKYEMMREHQQGAPDVGKGEGGIGIAHRKRRRLPGDEIPVPSVISEAMSVQQMMFTLT